MGDTWSGIVETALLGFGFTAAAFMVIHARKAVYGIFFGREFGFDPKSSPIRYGIVLAFFVGWAVFCWAKLIWLLLGRVIGT